MLSPWPPWQSLKCWVAVCIAPPSKRLPVRLNSRSQSTMAALPEPIVNDAKAALMSLRESDVSALRWWIVASTSARLLSVPTTTPARICPSSIMLATWIIPFNSPRQAFDTS